MKLGFLKRGNIFFSRFRRSEEGATAMEYGLLVALLAIALMLGLSQFYESLDSMFVTMDKSVSSVNSETEG